MKEKIKTVKSWSELLDFVESINPYKKTIVLSGWLSEVRDEHRDIKQLIFSTKNVEVLCEESGKKKIEKKKTRKTKV